MSEAAVSASRKNSGPTVKKENLFSRGATDHTRHERERSNFPHFHNDVCTKNSFD